MNCLRLAAGNVIDKERKAMSTRRTRCSTQRCFVLFKKSARSLDQSVRSFRDSNPLGQEPACLVERRNLCPGPSFHKHDTRPAVFCFCSVSGSTSNSTLNFEPHPRAQSVSRRISFSAGTSKVVHVVGAPALIPVVPPSWCVHAR